MDDQRLAQRLKGYFAAKRPGLSDVRVVGLRRFFGGSSKPTYRADLLSRDADGERQDHVVIRLTPETSLVDHSDDNEAVILDFLNRRDFTVPVLHEVETDPVHLGAPFFVMDEIRGCETAPHMVLQEPYVAHRVAIGERKWQLLGMLAGYALRDDERAALPASTVDTAWRIELDKWESYYRVQAQEPEPLVDHALRWLRRNPPPSAPKLSFVHGDYRTGNFLYDRDGAIHGVLDWEMAHVGDPHEDVAWAICPSWGWPERDRPGFLIPQAEAFRIWEQASGLGLDPVALHWWSVFTTVKGVGLWAACARNVIANGSVNSIEFAACWFPRDLHLRLMSELLLPEFR